jgi:hypothetical protein
VEPPEATPEDRPLPPVAAEPMAHYEETPPGASTRKIVSPPPEPEAAPYEATPPSAARRRTISPPPEPVPLPPEPEEDLAFPPQEGKQPPEPPTAARVDPEPDRQPPPAPAEIRPTEAIPPRDAESERQPIPPAAKPADRQRRLDKDGVRDIWARLQAMDDPPSSRATPDAADETEPPDGTPRESDPVPWERQDIYGFFPGLLLTLRQVLLHPTDFFTAMPEGRPRSKALVFNLLINEFLLLIDFLWTLMGIRAKLGTPGQGDLTGVMSTSPSLGFLLALLLVPPLLAVGVYLDAWLTHLLLRLFRSAKKSYSETFRVMCYSAAPMVLSAVPVAGQILSPLILVWYMALQAIGLRQIHQGSYTQILAAVFIKWSLYLFMVLAVLQGFAPQ